MNTANSNENSCVRHRCCRIIHESLQGERLRLLRGEIIGTLLVRHLHRFERRGRVARFPSHRDHSFRESALAPNCLGGFVVIILLIGLLVADSFIPRPSCAATSGTWIDAKTGGVWSNPSNWAGGSIAGGTDAVADFSSLNITADNTVTLDGPRTAGTLIFGDTTPSNNWIVSGANVLTLATSSGAPTIQVNNQITTIYTGVSTSQDLIKTGGGTLALVNNFPLQASVIRIDSGVLSFGAITTAGISVNVDNGLTLYSISPRIGGLFGSGSFSIPTSVNLDVAASTSGNADVYSGVISGTGTLTVDGGSATSPALTLTGANAFSGTTLVRGFLQLNNANALQNSVVSWRGGAVGFSSGIGTYTVGSSDGGLVLNDGSGAPIKLRVGANNSDFSPWVFSGNGSLEKVGTGTMDLSGAYPSPEAFAGDLVVSAGSVKTWFNALKNTSVVVNADGGLKFGLGNIFHAFFIGGLSGSANFSLVDSNGKYVSLIVGSNNSDSTYSGVISGIGTPFQGESVLEKAGTGTLTLTAANKFPATSALAGTLKVTGSLAQNGSANVYVAAGRDFSTASLIRRVQSGSSYGGFGSSADDFLVNNSPRWYAADIRAGKNNGSSASDFVMQWRTSNSNDGRQLASEVLNLTGMSPSSGNHSQTDPFVLQMTYNQNSLGGAESALAADGLIDLAWLDTSVNQPNGLWVNATLGNFGTGLPGDVFQNVQSSWDAFAAAHLIDDSNIGDFLGSYGVDITSHTHTVWAIVNHNSQFSVVPEPSSWFLLALGAAASCAMLIGRRRNSRA
jgi:hypothetical protein